MHARRQGKGRNAVPACGTLCCFMCVLARAYHNGFARLRINPGEVSSVLDQNVAVFFVRHGVAQARTKQSSIQGSAQMHCTILLWRVACHSKWPALQNMPADALGCTTQQGPLASSKQSNAPVNPPGAGYSLPFLGVRVQGHIPDGSHGGGVDLVEVMVLLEAGCQCRGAARNVKQLVLLPAAAVG